MLLSLAIAKTQVWVITLPYAENIQCTKMRASKPLGQIKLLEQIHTEVFVSSAV